MRSTRPLTDMAGSPRRHFRQSTPVEPDRTRRYLLPSASGCVCWYAETGLGILGVKDDAGAHEARSRQTRSHDSSWTEEFRSEQLRLLGAIGDLCVEALDGGVHRAELRDGGLDEQQQGSDDGGVGGQRLLGLNGVEASSDGGLAPYVVTSEEVDERVLASALRGVERRPALEKCGKDGRVLVTEPAKN